MTASYVNEKWGRQRIVTFTGGDRELLIAPASFESLYDPTLCVQNFGYLSGTYNSQSATTTSQLIKYVLIRPQYALDVSKVLSASGTAVA